MPISSVPLPGDEDPLDSSSQVAWLRSLGDRQALFQVMDGDGRSIRSLEAAEALAQLGDVRGLDHLIATLNNPASRLRMEAAEILQHLDHPRGLRALRESGKETQNSAGAARREEVYEDLNAATTDELVAIWHEDNRAEWTDMEFEVIEGILTERLGKLPRRSEGQDEELEIDDQVDPRIQQLWKQGDGRNLRRLMEQEPGVQLRLEAAEALADMGEEDGLDFLIAMLDDEQDEHSEVAAEMLDWLDLPRGNAALRERGISFDAEGDVLAEPRHAQPVLQPAIETAAPEPWVSREPRLPGVGALRPESAVVSRRATIGAVITGAVGGILGFLLVGIGLQLIGLRALPDEWRHWLNPSVTYWVIESLVLGGVGGSIGWRTEWAKAARDGDAVDEQDPRLMLAALSGGAIFTMVAEAVRFLLSG